MSLKQLPSAAGLGLHEHQPLVALRVGAYEATAPLGELDPRLVVMRREAQADLQLAIFGSVTDNGETHAMLQPVPEPFRITARLARDQGHIIGDLQRDYAHDVEDESPEVAERVLALARDVDPWHDEQGNPVPWTPALGPEPRVRHPLPVGTRIKSRYGESDGNGESEEGSIGVVQHAAYHGQDGWGYDVLFPLAKRASEPDDPTATHVLVMIDKADGLDDLHQYVILGSGADLATYPDTEEE